MLVATSGGFVGTAVTILNDTIFNHRLNVNVKFYQVVNPEFALPSGNGQETLLRVWLWPKRPPKAFGRSPLSDFIGS